MERKLLTRRQVVELWQKNKKYMNYYVCPNCRDLLQKEYDGYKCTNEECGIKGSVWKPE
jgi:hypothetical protein